MQLNSIEIKGFKSFADRTQIHFNQRITGVVGPNGSGKSNIVDAIRWVLGEQKTSLLRSEKMENVIFNGTKSRKSASLAQVTLELQNTKNTLPTEYTTVTITRILYRNGESEYRINNVPCRRKDILDLFMDTGITSDSYAIIELSMVDEILTDREDSRRRLLEQAAGISKYKSKKKEALNKLSATEADLNRVEDLLYEIENNLKQLEAQARKAKRYKDLKAKYRDLSLLWAYRKIEELNRSTQELEQQKTTIEDRKLQLQTEINQKEAELLQIKSHLVEQEKKLSENQKAYNRVSAEINRLESEKKVAIHKKEHYEQTHQGLLVKIEENSRQIESLRQEIEGIEKEIAHQQEVYTAKKAVCEQLKTELHQIRQQETNHRAEFEKVRRQIGELQSVINQLDKAIAINTTKKDNLLRELRESEKQNDYQEEKKKELLANKASLADEIEALKQELEKCLTQKNAIEENVRRLEQLLEQSRQEATSVHRKLDARINKQQLLKSLIDNLEGFPESIKYLKKKFPPLKNAPLLTDIIYCHEDYRRAIENYLEPLLNHFVVDSAEEALQAIQLLNEASKGRANFFLLSEFAGYKSTAPWIHENVIPATEVIEVDEKYRHLIAYLFDHVYLTSLPAEEIENLIQSDTANHRGYTFLTADGKVIRRRYTVSGGSVGLFEGIRLGRLKNLEKLNTTIKQLQKELDRVKSYVMELEAEKRNLLAQLPDERINALEKQILKQENNLLILEKEINRIETTSDQYQVKKAQIDEAVLKLTNEMEQTEGELKQRKNQLQQLQSVYAELENNLNAIATKASSIQEAYNRAISEFHVNENKLNQLTGQCNYKKQALQNLINSVESDKKQIVEAVNQIGLLKDAIQKFDRELQEQLIRAKALENKLTQEENQYFQQKGTIAEFEDAIKQLNKKINNEDALLQAIHEKFNELRMQLNSLKDRMEIEFHINILDIQYEDVADMDSNFTGEEDLQAHIQKLRQRLDNYGEVNPMAIEAYEEMKQRYDFITGQKNDLLEARDSLLQTIQEIEETAEKRFKAAFEQVRENFVRVFRTLFTEEDNCDLILTDPSNPLESKIEVFAQPKGKKPLVINQLSGGEKALTALAFLFALYLLKPAPFCILDEVDAPLDDVNIEKFNNMIRKFSDESQFIIVTHNKQTMAAVDVIYGVTMVEQGVSKVVPVDLRALAVTAA